MSTSLVAPPLRLARRAMSAMSIASDGFTAFDRVSAPGPAQSDRQRDGRLRELYLPPTFLGEQGRDYYSAMSSPLSAADESSRSGDHVAFGTVSNREAAQALWRRGRELLEVQPPRRPPGFLASPKSFESRLHWHYHFIQTFESEPASGSRNRHLPPAGTDAVRRHGHQYDPHLPQPGRAGARPGSAWDVRPPMATALHWVPDEWLFEPNDARPGIGTKRLSDRTRLSSVGGRPSSGSAGDHLGNQGSHPEPAGSKPNLRTARRPDSGSRPARCARGAMPGAALRWATLGW